MSKIKILFLIIIFVNFAAGQNVPRQSQLSDDEGSDISFPKKLLMGDKASKTEASEAGGSRTYHEAISPSEAKSMEISRKIISPIREEGYFPNETIVVLVKTTSLKKGGLKDIEIWEIPGSGLEIINCSYPIKTTWIEYILDYEIHERSYLLKEDLDYNKMTNLSKLLNNHTVPIYYFIYNKTSNETKRVLNNNPINTTVFSDIILKDFNKIIDKENLYLNRSLFSESNISYRRNNVFYSELNSPYEDHKLVNRRLLEDAFPGIINKSSLNLNKEHESLGIKKSLNAIKYSEEYLNDRESIIFKYYLKPTELGNTNIRSIIRSEGFLYEDSTPIKVIERDPKFEYELLCESKDLDLYKPYDFTYSIKYLGGDDEEKCFSINITAPESCKILKKCIQTSSGKCIIEDNVTINLSLSKGITKKIIIKAEYSEEGSKLSPPSISINNVPKEVEADISVYRRINWLAKRNYEIFSILLGLIVFIEAIVILKDRYSNDNLLQNNNAALIKLAELIDKKLK